MSFRILLLTPLFLFIHACKAPQNEKGSTKVLLSQEVKEPSKISPETPILFLLHGYGSNEKDLFSLSQYVDKSVLVVSPRAPIMLGENRYCWYNINQTKTGLKYNFQEVTKAVQTIKLHIEQVTESYKLKGNRIYVGGFSQGAILSLGLASTYPELLNGIVVLNGALYPEFKDLLLQQKTSLFPSVFLTHGSSDEVLPIENIKDAESLFKTHGIEHEVFYHDKGHTLTQESMEAMIRWINQKVKDS